MNYYTDVLKKYMVFDGRAGRKEYWMFVLCNLIATIIISIIDGIFRTKGLLIGIYALAILLPNLGVSVRRLHDTDHSGWWMFISLVPFVGSIILLYFLIIKGTPGANRYGSPAGDVIVAPTPQA